MKELRPDGTLAHFPFLIVYFVFLISEGTARPAPSASASSINNQHSTINNSSSSSSNQANQTQNQQTNCRRLGNSGIASVITKLTRSKGGIINTNIVN